MGVDQKILSALGVVCLTLLNATFLILFLWHTNPRMNTEGAPGTRGRSRAAQDPDLLSRLGAASRAGTSVQQEAPPREAVVKGAGADSAATLAERLGPPGASRLPLGSPQGSPPPHPNQTPSRHCPDQIRLFGKLSCNCVV